MEREGVERVKMFVVVTIAYVVFWGPLFLVTLLTPSGGKTGLSHEDAEGKSSKTKNRGERETRLGEGGEVRCEVRNGSMIQRGEKGKVLDEAWCESGHIVMGEVRSERMEEAEMDELGEVNVVT
ncbi:hypothetical protein E2C01_032626 [Portunus trituberculatus]|uniref:Uncharacterized protein n=1 Tax=Portunus trituberculatus TaxID=210409 RepID=A0A5B7F0X1_PORTR|nr:hypothetical protein [Portunus trituberculatus]